MRLAHPVDRADPGEPHKHEEHALRLQTALAVALSCVVVAGALALVLLEQRISRAYLRMPVEQRAEEPAVAGRSHRKPPTLLLVLLDGLRADRFEAAPRLREFAEQAVSFSVASAQATHPTTSLSSIYTGKYPATLLLEERNADLVVLASVTQPSEFLGEAFAGLRTTLGDSLAAAGYRTAAFGDVRTARVDPGCEHRAPDAPDLDTVVSTAGLWLARDAGDAFVVVRSDELIDSRTPEEYDKKLSTVDTAVGQLLELLDECGRLDEAVVVVTSPFGQSLGERGLEGGGELYLEQLLVPLFLRMPSSWALEPRAVSAPVELVDVFPTLLAACNEKAPRDLDGTSLLSTLFGGSHGRQFLVAQTTWSARGARPAKRSVISPGSWQVIHDAKTDVVEFYSLERDPRGLESSTPGTAPLPPFIETLLSEASLKTSGGGVE